MYKIQDVKLTTSFFERIFGLSTITCYTGDITTPELVITHVKHAKEIKSYLLKASRSRLNVYYAYAGYQRAQCG